MDIIIKDRNQGIPFNTQFERFINQYAPGLSNIIGWGFLVNDNKTFYIRSTPLDKYEKFKQSREHSEFDYYYARDLFFDIKQNPNDCIVLPLTNHAESCEVILIKNKSALLQTLKLDNLELIYDRCPLLIRLLLIGVRESYRQATSLGLYATYLKENENNVHFHSLLYDIVAQSFNWLDLPYISFFHAIANSNYEGQENNGYITLMDSSFNSNDIDFSSIRTIDEYDIKYMRKLVQMTDENIKLILKRRDKEKIVFKPDFSQLSTWEVAGLSSANNTTSIASIRFLGASKWEMKLKDETLLYNGERFIIKNNNINSDATSDETIKKFFEPLNTTKRNKKYQKFLSFYRKIKEQKHGTMLIVTENAKNVADLFCTAKRGIQIKHVDCSKWSDQVVQKLSSIDGAIVISPDCECYALGVILDGKIDSKYRGNEGRGARYNSAELYIRNLSQSIFKEGTNTNSSPLHTMAIVISEDGYIDVFSSKEEMDFYKLF